MTWCTPRTWERNAQLPQDGSKASTRHSDQQIRMAWPCTACNIVKFAINRGVACCMHSIQCQAIRRKLVLASARATGPYTPRHKLGPRSTQNHDFAEQDDVSHACSVNLVKVQWKLPTGTGLVCQGYCTYTHTHTRIYIYIYIYIYTYTYAHIYIYIYLSLSISISISVSVSVSVSLHLYLCL